MPFPNSLPSAAKMVTASPDTKSPSTPVIPTGRRLLPESRAPAAPSSTVTRPRDGFPYNSHNLNAPKPRLLGRKTVPTPCPLMQSSITWGRIPGAMTVATPPLVAMRAARTLLSIPPEPRGPLLPVSTPSSSERWRTSRMMDAFGSSFGLAEYRPVSYTHLRAHETVLDLVCRLLLEKKKTKN